MKDVVRVCCVGGYVAFGLYAAWRARASPWPAGRRAVNAFLLYTLAVSFGAGLLQKDVWPFSTWPLVAGIQKPIARHPRLVAVDGLGNEHNVDYRAWQPFVSDELLAWSTRRLLELGPVDGDRAADFLVGLAEHGRQQAARGAPVGYFHRLWGPLTAPYFLLHPAWWSAAETTPTTPLVGLRLYLEVWTLEERRLNPSAVQRVLLYEYRRP